METHLIKEERDRILELYMLLRIHFLEKNLYGWLALW